MGSLVQCKLLAQSWSETQCGQAKKVKIGNVLITNSFVLS